jgi:uncharacterized protein with LGFP repeats
MSPDIFPTVELADAVESDAGMIEITPELEEEALDQADEIDAQASEGARDGGVANAAPASPPESDPLDILES